MKRCSVYDSLLDDSLPGDSLPGDSLPGDSLFGGLLSSLSRRDVNCWRCALVTGDVLTATNVFMADNIGISLVRRFRLGLQGTTRIFCGF